MYETSEVPVAKRNKNTSVFWVSLYSTPSCFGYPLIAMLDAESPGNEFSVRSLTPNSVPPVLPLY